MNEHLNWRYSTQKFDATRKVSHDDWVDLLEVLRLAPSSFGLQPWKFVVVDDPKLRRQIKDFAWGQSQITDASHLIVFCSLTMIDDVFIKKYIARVAEVRAIEIETLVGYEKSIRNFISSQSHEMLLQWAKRQVYIPLGMFLDGCARRKIDASPMEGFDIGKVDALLKLSQENITAVTLCAVGHRAFDDKYAAFKKVRFDSKDIFLYR